MVFNFLSIVHYSITLLCGRVMLLCAGILGRFYTDYHDVDEDLRTVTNQGGFWSTWGINESAGMMCRQENYTHIYSDVFVASSNMKNSLIIRTLMMSTKIWWLLLIVVQIGLMESWQVLHVDLWATLLLLQGLILLLDVDIWEIFNYTADHDVDENEPTIANFGGPWRFGDVAGVSCRYVSAPIHYTENNVASLKK